MKNIICIFVLILTIQASAQERYLTRTGTLQFEASVPSFEEVAAKNMATTAILNTANGEFASLALVNGFRFKNALMEEHFNENYAESEEYPKTTFKGKIADFSLEKIKESSTFRISGELTFHGVKKQLNDIPVELSISDNTIVMKSTFKVLTSDFDIKIPNIVKNKVSKEVMVTFNFELIAK